MSKAQQKAEGFTKQLVGQMIGDELLVREGKEQERKAAGEDTAEAKPQPEQESQEERPAQSRKDKDKA